MRSRRKLALVAVAVRRRMRNDEGQEGSPPEVEGGVSEVRDDGPDGGAEEPAYLPLGRGVGVPRGVSIYLPLGIDARAGGPEVQGPELMP